MIGPAGYLGAVLVAGVFAWAGLAKAADRRAAAAAFSGLRLPAPRLLARVVPVAELLLALLLVAVPTAGAAVALLALVGFSVVLVRARAGGAAGGCACFGGSSADTPLVVALLRNGLLAAAAVAALGARPTLPDLPTLMAAGTLAAVAVVCLTLFALRTRVGPLWDTRLAEEPERTS